MAGKGGGFGGSWKVAYADFVTAMMALFMVLWIMSQEEEILEATSEYFKNPFVGLRDRSGLMREERIERAMHLEGSSSHGESLIDLQFLRSLADDVYRMLSIETDTDRPVDIQVTSDGLRIVAYDRRSRPFFEDGAIEFTEWGDFVIRVLAWIVERHDFSVVIDGHVASGIEYRRPDFGPWELTAERANAARRAMVRYAVRDDQIERVTGFADTVALPDTTADADENHRITLSLRIDPSRRNGDASSGGELDGNERPQF